MGFFFTGKSRYSVLKHGVGVEWDPRRTAAQVPFHFDGFFTPFYATCLLKFQFFRNCLL